MGEPTAEGPDGRTGKDDGVEGWSLLVRYYRMAVGEMDHNLRERSGYSLDHYDVLHQVGLNDGPIRMGDLAAALLVANSSCNRIVGRLVDDGHLARVKGEHDRREVLVTLTPQGRKLRRKMAAVHTRDIRRLFGEPLDSRDHRALRRSLTGLIEGRAGGSVGE